MPVPKYKIYDGKNFLYKQPRLFQNDDNVNKEKIEKNHINGWSFDANVEWVFIFFNKLYISKIFGL